MTALEREFSRKQFMKGGGALIVGFSMLGAPLAGKAQAADSPYASNGPHDHYQIDSWIAIHEDNTASIKSGSIFQGTGSTTGILMIAAEELDMDLSQVSHVRSDTNVTPMTGVKSGSNTIISAAGKGVRAGASSARQALLELASKQLAVPVSSLSVSKGVVSGGGRSVSYGDLLGGKLFNVRMPDAYNMTPVGGYSGMNGGILPGQALAKQPSEYKVVGTNPARSEIPAIASGSFVYIQDVRTPGMLHGRIVRPRGQAVFGFETPIVSIDESSIKHIPNAQIVRKNDFLGVVAPNEYDAIQAAAQLKVKWADPPAVLAGSGNEFEQMRALDSAGKTIWSRASFGNTATNAGDVEKGLASAAHVVEQTFSWPTNAHTPMGSQCAIADVTPHGARILTGTQSVYRTRTGVSQVLGLPQSLVRVTEFGMGGCFGDGSQYVDAAQAAALMSQAVGKPVRVQLMRWDEFGYDAVTPGTLMDIRAGIDAKGNLVAFDYVHIYPRYAGRTNIALGDQTAPASAGVSTLAHAAAGLQLAPSRVSGHVWPATMYEVPNNRYLLKSIPLENTWLKAEWMRAGSTPHATFAAEQVIDDLARAANMDPVAFRIQNATKGARREPLLEVLNAVTKAANWQPKVSGSKLSEASVVSGRGFAWSNAYSPGSPAAAVADIQVDKKTGKITVKHVYQALNAGLVVFPRDVENQIVGGTIQIVSRLLMEQYRYSRTNATSGDFVTYPILRFTDAPKVTPIVVQRINDLPSGVGEPVAVVPAAAVANAFFDATGVRMRTAPMSPARVRAVLKAAGVA
jgi:CO/xanthine dehydrogenase Mo-binding subunit